MLAADTANPLTASTSDTVTATLTWVDDSNTPVHPSPKRVLVTESAWAEYNTMNPTDTLGSSPVANNGLGDSVVNFDHPYTTNPAVFGYDRVSGVNASGSLIAHYSVQDGSTGTIILTTLILSASVESTPAPPSDDNYGTEAWAGTYYNVTVNNITLSSPNPSGRPDLGDGSNQYTYGGQQPDGYLFVPGTTTVVGGTQDMAQWLIDNNTIDMKVEGPSISGAFSHTWSVVGNQIGVATNYTDEYGMAGSTDTQWVFKGLPDNNIGFGNHEVNLYVQGTNTQTAHIQTFYSGDASNWPGSDGTPNWYHYYQDAGYTWAYGYDPDTDHAGWAQCSPINVDDGTGTNQTIVIGETYSAALGPAAPKRPVIPVFGRNSDTNRIMQIGRLYSTKGIFSYLDVEGHELEHIALWLHNDSVPPWLAPDVVDSDGDSIPDDVEKRYGLDPEDADTTGVYGGMAGTDNEGQGDVECLCDIAGLGKVLSNGSAWYDDWADFGVQHGPRSPLFPYIYYSISNCSKIC